LKEDIQYLYLIFTMDNKAAINYNTANLNRRILAMIVDMILIGLIMMPLSYCIDLILPRLMIDQINLDTEIMLKNISLSTFMLMIYQSGILVQAIIVQSIYIFIIIFLYFISLKKFSTTPGKKLCNCKVINLATGDRISTKQALYRSIAMPFSLLTCGIGILMIEFTKNNQALHDKIAKTVVVIQKTIK
jgi:uncharacterized RDD family membrane protein YckC